MKATRWEDKLQELAKVQMGELPYAITTLMSRSKLNWKWKIDPEQAECIRFADMLRIAAKEGRLKCIWFHCPNEGSRHVITALILKAMGLLSGVLDYCFLGKEKGVIIEFKRADKPCPKDFKDSQKLFAIWAQSFGIPVYLHNQAEDALESLRREGLLI